MRKNIKKNFCIKIPRTSERRQGLHALMLRLARVIKYSPDSNEMVLDIRHESYRAAWLGCDYTGNFNLGANYFLDNCDAARGVASVRAP